MAEPCRKISSPTPVPATRICNIAGRFLAFDVEDIAVFRRRHNTSGNLVGTTPQQPTQNLFLSLPVELRAEEAEALVQCDAAFIVDGVAAHWETLPSLFVDPKPKKAYVESLRRQKLAVWQALVKNATKATDVTDRLLSPMPLSNSPLPVFDTAQHGCDMSSSIESESLVRRTESAYRSVPGLTLVSSGDLIQWIDGPTPSTDKIIREPFCHFLQREGYYSTPGLRFGAQYSVYPGDPLRFHAHFMANEYEWNTEIPILDLVGGGRLATAVKKSFLIGSQKDSLLTTFSIEWAAM